MGGYQLPKKNPPPGELPVTSYQKKSPSGGVTGYQLPKKSPSGGVTGYQKKSPSGESYQLPGLYLIPGGGNSSTLANWSRRVFLALSPCLKLKDRRLTLTLYLPRRVESSFIHLGVEGSLYVS